MNPNDGSVYFTNSDGDILGYVYGRDAIETVAGENLRKDSFGTWDPTVPGYTGYNWRQTLWYEPENVIYGVHGNSGYLFRFDPAVPQVDVLERLTSEPSKRSGVFDKFYHGLPGVDSGAGRPDTLLPHRRSHDRKRPARHFGKHRLGRGQGRRGRSPRHLRYPDRQV